MCSQSEFFRLACRKHTDSVGGFKEAQSSVVDLPGRKGNTGDTEPEDFRWDTDAEDPVCVKHMIHYFYHLDYLEEQTARVRKLNIKEESFNQTHGLEEGILIDHARMYAMGDKYGIPGLKDLALKKYDEAYLHTSAGLANSITVAYTSTIDTDRDLRDVITKYLMQDLTCYMKKAKIDQTVKDLPQLSHTLLRKQLKLAV